MRIRVGVPPGGLGRRLDQIMEWLDANCGGDGWATVPSGSSGIVNDALSIFFLDAAMAGAFVARWCKMPKPETVNGLYQVRDDEPLARAGTGQHKTP